jgi:Raf kinase inhibitor-like YbhB/YbcL family protein
MRITGSSLLPALALGLLVGLAGCGESASNSPSSATSTTSAASGAAPASAHTATHSAAVAVIAGKPVTKASYEHWLVVERALGGDANADHRALAFLVTSRWLLDEAAARGVSVSAAEAKQRLSELERQNFSKAGSLQKFLAHAHETESDLLARVKVELLESRIAAQVAAGQSGAQRKATLASFQRSFQTRWKARTTCVAGYVMEDCSEYHGKPENLTSTSSASTSSAAARSSSSKGSSSGAASSSSSASGEVYSSPGSMAITSSAFERNGAIPAQYTCDGANISPPLEWQNVPAKAAALVLFVIDDTPTGSASGIRWVVGDISPSSKGVAAGKTPAGGIVGSDTQGHSGYGGICPAHGKTSTVEFVLYALKKPIPLSPGFSPTTAESEYGSGKDLLGSAAVTYAVYHRS